MNKVVWLAVVLAMVCLLAQGRQSELFEAKFVGGQPVLSPERFPYFASIVLPERQFVHCVGVLVAPSTVLTSSECMYSLKSKGLIKNAYLQIGLVNPEKHAFTEVHESAGISFLRLSKPSKKPYIKFSSDKPLQNKPLSTLSRGSKQPQFMDSKLEMARLKYISMNEAVPALVNDPEISLDDLQVLFVEQTFNPFLTIAVGGEGRGSCMSENGAPILLGDKLAGIVIKTMLCNKVRKNTYVLFTNLAQLFDGWSPTKTKSIVV